ncbi:MAG TPA: sulfite exporter TauE/SafE family protein [Chryseolinea sp.]|nr:sulfite exporter TauE/SafE family protein [Chryseolinea sp.]
MAFTALIIGFAGSLHCIGMCSPLIMAATAIKPSVIFSRLIYNAGRLFTYALLGTIVTGIGMTLPARNYQNLLSIILGIALLLIALGGIRNTHIPFISDAFQSLSMRLKYVFSKYLRKKSYQSLFILGSINGLLPCGLTFLALTYCLTLQGPMDGFSFMLLFGIGTLPVMLGFTSILQFLIRKFHFNVKGISTGMLVLSGVVLIARVFIVQLPHATSFKDGVIDIVMCR